MNRSGRDDLTPHRGYFVRRQCTIHVVRHGETEFNRLRLLQGSSDPPLNADGQAQAQRAAERLAVAGVSAVVASPLLRARQTAAAIGRVAGVQASEDRRLRERAFGYLEGTQVEHLKRSDADLAKRLTEDARFAPHGGESRSTVATRAEQFITALLCSCEPDSRDAGDAVVVVHGGWCDIATTTAFAGTPCSCRRLGPGEVRKLLISELTDDRGRVMRVAAPACDNRATRDAHPSSPWPPPSGPELR